jgi:D-lactate dehydrogenase
MRVAVFSTKKYDQKYLEEANAKHGHEMIFFEPRLTYATAPLAEGCQAVCAFVNDELDETVLTRLAEQGTCLIALRAAGFNNVDLKAAERLKITVVRVPAYSPHAVAEHALALMLALNRKIHRAHARVREGNFSLQGLLGFDMYGRTLGIVGTGRIGRVMAEIMCGFGMRMLGYDPYPNEEAKKLGIEYVDLETLVAESDIISLHAPLTPDTYHLIDAEMLKKMKRGAMLINTSRGALIDTEAVIEALKDGQVGSLGLDVYEEEADLFFEDLSDKVIQDDVFSRLQTFPNVIITGHQAFFTEEALRAIAETTLNNISTFEELDACGEDVTVEALKNVVKARK